MKNLENLNLGDQAEKFKREGVFAYYRELIKIGDTIEAIRDVNGGEILRGANVKIADIIIRPKPNVRGFEKRIKLEGYEGEYNPKRFKKIP